MSIKKITGRQNHIRVTTVETKGKYVASSEFKTYTLVLTYFLDLFGGVNKPSPFKL